MGKLKAASAFFAAELGSGSFSGVLSFATGALRHAVLMAAYRAAKKPGGLMMSTEKKPAKRIYTLAAAIGLALGTMGVAMATADQTDQGVPSGVSDDEGAEVEGATDEATDGIDFQQEGENVGNNGGTAEGPDDVIGGADDAAEAATG